MRKFDIVIVGGGPSGLTFARLISNKYKVLLIDKRDLESSTGKPCGGLLAPDAQVEISRQKLSLPKEVLAGPQLFNVKTVDFDNHVTRYYPRHYINIDRHKFDSFLRSIILDVEIEDNTILKSISRQDKGYILEMSKNSEKEHVFTKYIIGADGANSCVRPYVVKKDNIERYICIQEWYKSDILHSSYGAIFDKKVSNYYAWYIQKDDHILLGAALKPNDEPNNKFNYLRKKLLVNDSSYKNPYRKEGQYLSRPKRLRDIKFCKNNIFLLGEASGLVSPSSGEGISYALLTARVLARIFNGNKHHIKSKYIRKIYKTKLKVIFKKLKSIIIYNKRFRGLIMKLNLTAIHDIK